MFELYNWIWDRLIPIKEYSVIYGDSNAGVGLVCCSIAAHVTAGKSLPDSRSIDADTVLFVSDNMDEFYKDSSSVFISNDLKVFRNRKFPMYRDYDYQPAEGKEESDLTELRIS